MGVVCAKNTSVPEGSWWHSSHHIAAHPLAWHEHCQPAHTINQTPCPGLLCCAITDVPQTLRAQTPTTMQHPRGAGSCAAVFADGYWEGRLECL